MAHVLDPMALSIKIRDDIRQSVERITSKKGTKITLAGILATDYGPSRTYASYTQKACEDVGIAYHLQETPRIQAEEWIHTFNQDPDIHGMMVYYPIFGNEQDSYLKDLVNPYKDIEGMHSMWLRMLYQNIRTWEGQPALLPCTPLAIIKLLTHALGATTHPAFAGKTITVFNRSEVVGRPLASMLAHDGAHVISFDVHGALELKGKSIYESNKTRQEALEASDIVITGVPSKSFPPVTKDEIKPSTICLNFSTLRNFEEGIEDKAGLWIPRVGPMTVTMALRNALRLYSHYQQPSMSLT